MFVGCGRNSLILCYGVQVHVRRREKNGGGGGGTEEEEGKSLETLGALLQTIFKSHTNCIFFFNGCCCQMTRQNVI